MSGPEFPKFSRSQLAAWARARADMMRNIPAEVPDDEPDAERTRYMFAHDAAHLWQIAAVLENLARREELPPRPEGAPPPKVDPVAEYGVSRNFLAALETVIEAHGGPRGYALLLFELHPDGRISLDTVANVPRAALAQSLPEFAAAGAFDPVRK